MNSRTLSVPSWQADWLPRLVVLAQDRRLSALVALLLIVLLAKALAGLTWTLLPAPAENMAGFVPPGSAPTQTRSAPARVSAASIERLHLFGEAGKAAPKVAAKVVDAPDTRLNLKLHGVLASDNAVIARAIIADGKGLEDAYAVDDKLPGNAVLKEIHADRIILEHRGRLETLRLPKDAKTLVNNRVAMNSIPGRRSAAAISASTTDTGALLRQYRDALVTDPQSVMELVRAEPVRDHSTGKLKGYRVRPGRDRQLLSRFGLRAGDVVTSINGIPMDNPLKALELMRDVTTLSQINLEVERNGTSQSFSFQID
ncbi:MAG TPA: type II secretion system protein GspC [Gammaproteobacteria bacterium]|nr:type II secretion system protein GspC [Gammaproteobacteria bacterium]